VPGAGGDISRLAILGCHLGKLKRHIARRRNQLHQVTGLEMIFYIDFQPAIIDVQHVTDNLLAIGSRRTAFVILVFADRVAVVEALGVTPVRHSFEFLHHVHVEWSAGRGVFDRTAVDLRRARGVIRRFGAALNF